MCFLIEIRFRGALFYRGKEYLIIHDITSVCKKKRLGDFPLNLGFVIIARDFWEDKKFRAIFRRLKHKDLVFLGIVLIYNILIFYYIYYKYL